MDKITHIKQLIWGTSLGMATDEEIASCHKHIKGYLTNHNSKYEICTQSKGTKVKRPDRSRITMGPGIRSFVETI